MFRPLGHIRNVLYKSYGIGRSACWASVVLAGMVSGCSNANGGGGRVTELDSLRMMLQAEQRLNHQLQTYIERDFYGQKEQRKYAYGIDHLKDDQGRAIVMKLPQPVSSPQARTQPTDASIKLYPSGTLYQYSLDRALLFDHGSTTLDEQGRAYVTQIVELLKGMEHVEISIEGHCDPDETDPQDRLAGWKLSTARAQFVLDMMMAQGIPPGNLSISGYSYFHPKTSFSSQSNRRRNRRIEIRVRASNPLQ
ncbi:OmpA family protein [Pontibacter sp. G13]|uniref:OmpA/MotB family protein n=1 Tax=Pontibacter sp. G13 TaxID=3074898 RepID=UPI00288C1080|nr:OmpA family protein [Pontibacter sp. G13]WNJ16231.1 OmpA family protein [Pontibacter sp. G13]